MSQQPLQFSALLTSQHARDIIARDRARAHKLLQHFRHIHLFHHHHEHLFRLHGPFALLGAEPAAGSAAPTTKGATGSAQPAPAGGASSPATKPVPAAAPAPASGKVPVPAPASGKAPAPTSASGGASKEGGSPVSPPAPPLSEGIDVTDAGVTYTAQVGIGSPPTQYTLLIDTGSSNTWVGASKSYIKTKTSVDTGARVNVNYGSGSFTGKEYLDTITISPDLVVTQQSIGVASRAQGFNGIDGILGMGPAGLTVSTTSTGGPVPTVTDNLFEQGKIPSNEIGIFYQPTTDGAVRGEITFGGVDTSRITDKVTYVPVTETTPASMYWGIDQDLKYAGPDGIALLTGSSGIVDTGTTLVLLASDVFETYKGLTGARVDDETGLLEITESDYEKLRSLFFKIGDGVFEMTPNAQIWPRALNSMVGGRSDKIYLVIGDLGMQSGQGLDFINGFAFLQRYYSVYDTGRSQIGLAPTAFTKAETN